MLDLICHFLELVRQGGLGVGHLNLSCCQKPEAKAVLSNAFTQSGTKSGHWEEVQ